MSYIKHIWVKLNNRIGNIGREFYRLCKSYSIEYAMYNLFWWISWYFRWQRINIWADRKKQSWIDKYIETHYQEIVEIYRNKQESDIPVEEFNVWVFWGQGIKQMPPLVSACYRQMSQQNRGGVKFIDMDNVHEYVDLPSVVYDKLKTGKLLYAHFSDILRNSLLAKYGGMWLDSTCWTAHPVPQEAHESVFFSPHNEIDGTNWCTYAMGSSRKNSVTFSFVRDMLIAVCARENVWPDYLFQDRLLSFAHRKIKSSKHAINATPTNSTRRFLLYPLMNKPYNNRIYQDLISTDWLFKLSYKSFYLKDVDGLPTFYSAILNGSINAN